MKLAYDVPLSITQWTYCSEEAKDGEIPAAGGSGG